jgi:uncharacterized membrane protein YqjE
MDTPKSVRWGEGLRGTVDAVFAALQTRLELLGVEWQEEKLRLTALIFNILLAALLLGFALLFAVALVTVWLWESHPLLALGLGVVIFLVGGVWNALLAARSLRQGSLLFRTSLAELARDREMIRGVLGERSE